MSNNPFTVPETVKSSDKTKAAKHDSLVYKVEEIAQILAISSRAAYNLCKSTKDFKVIRIGLREVNLWHLYMPMPATAGKNKSARSALLLAYGV